MCVCLYIVQGMEQCRYRAYQEGAQRRGKPLEAGTYGITRVRHDLVTEQQIYTHNIYTVEYYSTRNPTIYNNMDESRDYCAK